jgi:hypothetical protein
MTDQDGFRELAAELRSLMEKMDSRKKRDLWDKLPVITSFAGTVIIAALGLFLTQSYQRQEAMRQKEFRDAQIRIEQLKAITTLAPLLASSDTSQKRVARQMLQAVHSTSGQSESAARGEGGANGGPDLAAPGTQTAGGLPRTGRSQTALLDEFVRIALSDTAATTRRLDATRQIGEIGMAAGTPPGVRARAADAATAIATSNAPEEVRRTAADIVGQIRSLAPGAFAAHLAGVSLTRPVDGVILHHTATPAANYRGLATMASLGQFQTGELRWTSLSWHYAIAPDGTIWLGMPLNERAIHTRGQDARSVSVLLVMNGDAELPSEAQRNSLSIVLNALSARLQIAPAEMFSQQHGFHRDYPGRGGAAAARSCPGRLLTKPMVLSWLTGA